MNLVIWMNIPSHHQSQFFDSLNKICSEFKVFYYDKVPSTRSEMGWENDIKFKEYETYIDPADFELNLDDFREYIHILPGYGHPFLVKLRNNFSKNNIKWVHWSEKSRTGIYWYLSFFKKKLHAKYINKFALGAFAIGNQAKCDFINWGVERKKIEILPYSFNNLNYELPDQEILSFKKERVAFLFVGALCKRKGIDILLEAFSNKFKGDNQWCLVLVGNNKKDIDCKDLVNKLGIEDQVLFRGVIPSIKIMSAYKAADIFILPSRHDGWGMVVNEAVYCNLPVIASDAVGSSEHLIKPGINGFVFKANDPDSLAENMIKYKDYQLIDKQKELVLKEKIFSQYSSDSLSKYLIEILNSWISIK
ncbi:glycosyltransferase [Conchiformibius steedae DSM 2580]|uniref:Glycosyltransferase n=1 Tax=Conchiformibius steedae DSM 2580 TaxID=1121352 RepID=A0AAE9KZD1_9NEIS|nr:glycosyltransferase [Conchiformibius steedae]QMT34411.1 glycosyltransferase [Conchiformibius steedae]URD67191.1 glycosyltransferase [Conchiformibius steedae DSM 2580]